MAELMMKWAWPEASTVGNSAAAGDWPGRMADPSAHRYFTVGLKLKQGYEPLWRSLARGHFDMLPAAAGMEPGTSAFLQIIHREIL